MNNRKKTNIIIVVMLLAALAVLMVFYPHLPDVIPTHWGIDGQVDGTGPKSTLFILWAVVAGANLVMLYAEKIDPKGENYRKFTKVFNIFRIFFTVFMLLVLALNVTACFRPDAFDMSKIMYFMMGVMFILLGNYMPKVKHNYSFGIKMPWTLASENVWNKTHRMAGPVWVGGGVIVMLCSFLPATSGFVAMMAVMFAIVLIPTVYSYMAFRQEQENTDEK